MYKIKVSLTTNPFFFLYNKQPLRAWHNMCSTSISHEKGMFPYKTECIWLPWNKTARCPPLSFFLALKKKKEKLLNPTESSRQMQFPSPTPPWHGDGDIYPHAPLSSSSGLGVFLFLVYCVASRQSLHVFPWKPFCLLSIFLHYLPLPSAFQYVYFPPPFDFIFSHPPFLCISRCTLLPLF